MDPDVPCPEYVTDRETAGDLVPSWRTSFYVGYTACTRAIEGLSWLTKRGANQQAADGTYVDTGVRNRPVLLLERRGSTITQKEAIDPSSAFAASRCTRPR